MVVKINKDKLNESNMRSLMSRTKLRSLFVPLMILQYYTSIYFA